jgi:hypothetical protein
MVTLRQIAEMNEINPHRALGMSESYVSSYERDWLHFVAIVERKLGHSIDGDQDADGYSLDFAHDFFADGATPAEYVAEVRAEVATRKAR